MKKLPVIFISFLLGVSALWTQQVKMIVKVDRAVVYAEPSENGTKIDNIRRGTVLTLFKKGIEGSEWIYMTYQSERWKGKVTGFIKADLVVTEEEMLKEEQRLMEEAETSVEAAPKPEEVVAKPKEATEAEMKAEAEIKPKPQDELPDLKAVFAKKKPEEKEAVEEPKPAPEKEEVEIPEPAPAKPEEKEILEETPQAKEITMPEARVEEVEEFKRPEPPPPVITIKDGITESPQGRAFVLTQTAEMTEMTPYAIIKREFKPPPSLFKAEEKIVEEAQSELQIDVLVVKEEEKEILEETPQAKVITTPEVRVEEVEEFKRPEPPPPIVTVMDGITESPQGRAFVLIQAAEMAEMTPYAIIKREFKPPPPQFKAEEKIVEEAQSELQIDVLIVKKEEPPPEEEEIPDVEISKIEETPPEEEEEEPQAIKPPEQVVKPPEQVVKPTELPQPKQPDEIGLLSFGFGYGPSWGGFGGAVQLNIKDNIAIHIGAGLYPTKTYYSDYEWATNEWLYSIGIKYYLPFGSEKLRTYVDLMYGGISVEAVQLVREIWYNEYTFENIQKTLYGPSLMAGAELKFGFYALSAYLGLSYNTTAWDYWDRDYFLNGGIGFTLYF